MNYYNEFDPKAAAWLRELIKQGHIAPGVVDERSIEDVKPGDLEGYQQCHFFAGIGGWSLALRLAGWPDDQPVWTGSCPCQPFSSAGKGAGFADERHLWPAWFHLIRQRSPPVIFGEQVASAHRWLDLVHSDLEAVGYAVGAMPIEAASVGANHLRDRYWFVGSLGQSNSHFKTKEQQVHGWPQPDTGGRGVPSSIAVANAVAQQRHGEKARTLEWQGGAATVCNGIDDFRSGHWIIGHDGKARRVEPSIHLLAHDVPSRVVRLRGYGNAIVPQVAAEFIGAYQETKKQDLRKAA